MAAPVLGLVVTRFLPMPLARIFVSSVQKELATERRAILDFVHADPLLRRFFTVFLFEDLPAGDQRVDAVYLSEVDRCDIFVSLLGNEYGFEDQAGLSPTEHEFDRATARGKPRLTFVKGNDDQARHAKMAALLRKAGEQLIRRRFGSLPELTTGLYASLVDHLERSGGLRVKPFDASACLEATEEDLDLSKLELFQARARSQRGYAHGPGTPMITALAHLNLLDRNLPTHAAVLLFGARPQRFMPASEVKCMHFHGTTVGKPIPSYQIFKGSVFELVDQALDFVMSKIARRVGTRALTTQIPVDYELPREVVAEAIVNAVAHRDYASNASVQVMLFADRLEVWNPGELPAPLTVAELWRPHASIPRNPLIAEPMFLAGYVEKAGSGTLDMIARCAAAGLPEPLFRQDGGQFVQALTRPFTPEATPEATPEVTPEVTPKATPEVHIARLVNVLVGEMSRQQLQAALGLKDSSSFRRAYLQPALRAGLIEMTITDKPTSALQRYRLPTLQVAEATPEATPQVRLSRLLAALVGEMTRLQLQQATGLKDADYFRRAYLQPALDAGLIEMTAPDRPTSPQQRYRRRR